MSSNNSMQPTRKKQPAADAGRYVSPFLPLFYLLSHNG